MKSYLSFIFLSSLTASLIAADGVPFEDAQPLLERYCYDCHRGADAEGHYDVEKFPTESEYLADETLLSALEFVIAEHEMPPPKAKLQPSREEVALLHKWTVKLMDHLANAVPNDPGEVVMPRLTRQEYDAVVRDLTGYDLGVGSKVLPVEGGAGEGFANVGEAQSMTMGQVEKFLVAADQLLDHARVAPAGGINWSNRPLGPVPDPADLRLEAVIDWRQWYCDLLDARYAQIHKLGHHVYWLVAWRTALQPGADLADLCTVDGHELSPTIARQWAAFFAEKDSGNRFLDELRARFHALPSDETAAREELRAAEAWFIHWTKQPLSADDRTEDHYFGNGGQRKKLMREARAEGRVPYRLDFHRARGDQVAQVQIFITDCGDGNEDDVVVLRQGHFQYGKDVYSPEREVSWTTHNIQTADGQRLAWGSHPDGSALADDAVAVRAPAHLIIEVPEGANGFTVESFIDAERYPQATVQIWPGAQVPDDDEPVPRAHWIQRRDIEGAPEPRAALIQALRDANRVIGQMQNDRAWRDIWALLDLDIGLPVTVFDHTSLRLDIEEKRMPDPGGPDRPYFITVAQLREEASEAQRIERQGLRQNLIDFAQVPHQQLRTLLSEHGLEFPEGGLPDDAALAGLPTDAQAQARKLIHAVQATEAGLREQARAHIATFTRRAWRRPMPAGELDRLMDFYDQQRAAGASFDAAVKQPLRLALISPYFLYRWQRGVVDGEAHPLNGYELADRLAFALWTSLPDTELLKHAESQSLLEGEVIAVQVERMLQDPRSRALGEGFAVQWLGVSGFRNHGEPDANRFPEWDADVAAAMEAEVVHFFDDLFRNNRPLSVLIDADYTFLNETLAKHYDIAGVDGDQMRKVELPDDGRRGGVFTFGAVLTQKSMPLRTSAVLRGTWLLEQVLGEHLPEPPANVPQLSDDETNEDGESVAQQLARHRDDPACIGCHLRIDPLGIALEQFDPVGRWREEFVDGRPVDAVDTTADDVRLESVQGLRTYLKGRQDRVLRHFCQVLLGYVLGRETSVSDRPLIDEMLAALKADDLRVSAALITACTSHQFRHRREEPLAKE